MSLLLIETNSHSSFDTSKFQLFFIYLSASSRQQKWKSSRGSLASRNSPSRNATTYS
uniref:Uncharacterized protein MANES_16G083000 n=1 Tax=Rhizophora mucronata TaxID=61149 RepID=A0A2P2MVN8_RHIMU